MRRAPQTRWPAPPRPAGDTRPGFADQILPEATSTHGASARPAAPPPEAEAPSESETPTETEAPPEAEAPPENESPAEAVAPEPDQAVEKPGPEEEHFEEPEEEIEPPASFAETPPPVAEEAYGEQEDYSQFGYEPPFSPRRNLLRLWTIAAAVFALFALGAVFAVSYWGLPDWVPVSKPTFGLGQQDLVLDFPQDKQDRRELPNGTEFFGASGSVTNVGSQTRSVPPILIVLRDTKNRIVYTWEVTPPKRTLAPGESEAINEAVTDVPKSAKFAEFGWKPS